MENLVTMSFRPAASSLLTSGRKQISSQMWGRALSQPLANGSWARPIELNWRYTPADVQSLFISPETSL